MPVGAQSSRDPLEQIFSLLMSFGDVSTSWSRALPAADRFVVLADFNNEAVLDRNTGLLWQRTPDPVGHALMRCGGGGSGTSSASWTPRQATELLRR